MHYEISHLKLVPLSFLFFIFFNNLISSKTIPNSCKKPLTWTNIFTSIFHSFITGFGSLWFFIKYPNCFYNQLTTLDESGITLYLCQFTIGYFIYDTFDMIMKIDKNSKLDLSLMLHHSCCIFCFGWSLISIELRVYAMAAWLYEIQSIFLHFRRLLNLAQIDRTSFIYTFAKYLNFITFLIFRFYVNFEMTLVAWRDGGIFNEYVPFIGVFLNLIFFGLNLDIFLKSIKSDFMSKKIMAKKD